MADMMVFNLAICAAWLLRGGRPRILLLALAGLCLAGAAAAAQFSGYLALPIALLALGVVTGQLRRVLAVGIVAVPITAALMWPAIASRLEGFSSTAGLPDSWLGRWDNLNTFFWPELGDFNWVLGVRTAARVPAPETWREWVWVESGHTWLLWSGGVLLFVAFFVLLWAALRATAEVAHRRDDVVGVAAAAAFTSLCTVAALMTPDPHVTMRGSADLLYALMGLALVAGPQRPSR